jgi:hypothetical protein
MPFPSLFCLLTPPTTESSLTEGLLPRRTTLGPPSLLVLASPENNNNDKIKDIKDGDEDEIWRISEYLKVYYPMRH